jgi:hypothetical protein
MGISVIELHSWWKPTPTGYPIYCQHHVDPKANEKLRQRLVRHSRDSRCFEFDILWGKLIVQLGWYIHSRLTC